MLNIGDIIPWNLRFYATHTKFNSLRTKIAFLKESIYSSNLIKQD